jgi:AcrR family transcriptional regulator
MTIRDMILEATVKVFAEAGTRGATTRRIAQEAGVNEVTLFRHFGSKEALLREALFREGREVHIPPLPEQPVDAAAELTEWCLEHLHRLREAAPIIRTCLAEFEERPEVSACGCQVPLQAANQLAAYLDRLKEAGRMSPEQSSRAAAAMLMGAIFADAMGRDLMPERYPYSMEEGVATYVRIFLRGIS